MEQRLLESNKALDEFAHVASHDLKSPLRGIDNLCRFIEEDLNDEAAASVSEHLARMHGRVHRMEKLLDDLLEYSRVGRGEQRVQKIGVATLVSNVTRLLDVPAGFHVCTKDPLPVLTTFVTPLEQVFRNLIHNAIKHHDSDHGRIVVSAVECGRLVEFTVQDDGPGIAPQFHDRIFRMFTTLAPRDEVEGSGLGLPLIVKLTRHYGGDVWLDESANGERGAIFRFTWPKTVMEDTV